VIPSEEDYEVVIFPDHHEIPEKLVNIHRGLQNALAAIKKLGVSSGTYKGIRFEIQKTKTTVDLDKKFDGNEADAIAAGWQENEFGWVCQDCATPVDEYSGAVELSEALVKAIVPDLDNRTDAERRLWKPDSPGQEKFTQILKSVAPTVISEDFCFEVTLLGWFPLIYDCCLKLEAINRQYPALNRIKAIQVKEKLGTLRFYSDYATREVDEVIAAAERESAKTCYYCGDPGSLENRGGWLLTICSRCETLRHRAI
jgi:hypothetical protein